jgi:hypothetical protein
MPMVVPQGQNREMAEHQRPGRACSYFQNAAWSATATTPAARWPSAARRCFGRQGWYLEEQLKKFKTGKRGATKG